MQEQFPFPTCFSGGRDENDDNKLMALGASKSGQSALSSVYRVKIAGCCHLVTITWCRNLFGHGLSVCVEATSGGGGSGTGSSKFDLLLRPWNFWKRQGSKRVCLDEGDDVTVEVFWDLRDAKFASVDPEPVSGYYVAVVSDHVVVLVIGDLKKDAFRRSESPPSVTDAVLVSKKEHVFGKRKFSTKAKFHEKGSFHDITIECKCNPSSAAAASGIGAVGELELDREMLIRVDGSVAIHVKHLQWKFRGNGSFSLGKIKVEVFWNIHDWIFGPGLRHALFIFRPTSPPPSPSPSKGTLAAVMASPLPPPRSCSSDHDDILGDGSSDFSLFLYAWKVES
ncbi:hypothetical protein ZOSMA_56G00420 [Zostera marina]|uniref:DUF868 family protein n=1 Tax=Zostera marina TaxID=29655 RepID=A0A0K9NVL7_ZOSMR|nr:hypothetical protein ZOSMA_56G00420 [Zostera marina]